MDWRTSAGMKQRRDISEFLEFLLRDDVHAVREHITKFPELTREQFQVGNVWIEELTHYIYGGDTALHVAAVAHNVEVIELLVQHGADVHACNRRGARPLHYAADGGPNAGTWDPERQAATVEKLIALGADVNALDKSGVAPLHRAVRNRGTGAVKALIACGADVGMKNKNGSTPLLLAQLTTGKSGSGTAEAKREQAIIAELLAAAVRG